MEILLCYLKRAKKERRRGRIDIFSIFTLHNANALLIVFVLSHHDDGGVVIVDVGSGTASVSATVVSSAEVGSAP